MNRVAPSQAGEKADADVDVDTAIEEMIMEALVETDVVVAAPITDEPKMKVVSDEELLGIADKITDAEDSWKSVVDELETVCIVSGESKYTLLTCLAGDKRTPGLTEYLLKAGVPANAKNICGETPLAMAVMWGNLPDCQLLSDHGAEFAIAPPGQKPSRALLVEAALRFDHHHVALWLLHHPNYRWEWSNSLFAMLCERSPHLIVVFLNIFAVDLAFDAPETEEFPNRIYDPPEYAVFRNKSSVYYVQLAEIYGEPSESVVSTALAMVIKTPVACDALACKVMRYIIKAKWTAFGQQMFRREVFMYTALVAAYSLSVICEQGRTWNSFHGARQYVLGIGRTVAAVASASLLLQVERRELRVEGPAYFFSFWNLLAVGTYIGVILVAVFQAFGFQSELLQAMTGLLNVTLWFNVFQYLQMAESVAVLITMMSHMVSDVAKSILLYTVFLFGFSGGFYVFLLGNTGYETFVDALITVLLMLFGQITYDPFNAATGLTWIVSNLLLLAYLVSVVVVLLNLLIAMLSTSYSNVWAEAEGQVLLSYAQIIIRMEKSLTKADRTRQFEQLKTDAKRRRTTPEESRWWVLRKWQYQRDRLWEPVMDYYYFSKLVLADPAATSAVNVVISSLQYLVASVILYIFYGVSTRHGRSSSPLKFGHDTEWSTLEDGERLEFVDKKPTMDEQETLSTRVDNLTTQVEELKSLVERQAASMDRQTALIESISGFVREHAARREATAFL